jgi:rsbT co-antagonist protein RsbR
LLIEEATVSESLNVDLLTRILERMPGVAFCSRFDPATGRTRWLYLGSRAGEFFGMPQSEIEENPQVLQQMVVVEDQGQIAEAVAHSMQSGAPFDLMGRVRLRSGEIRYMMAHATIELDGEGAVLWYGQMTDVTERKKLEMALAEAEAERARSEALYRQVVDALPVGVVVGDQKREFLVFNPKLQQLIGGVVPDAQGDMARVYGIHQADGVTLLRLDESGFARALRGESVEEEVVIRNPRLQGDVRLHTTWRPLLDGQGAVWGELGTFQDITLQRQLETELRARNEELAASEMAKAELIERLRHSIEELSNPILEVWDDVLVLPIIGVIDARRAADMVQRLLAEVTRSQASFVIIDLTGVEIVDTKTADHLFKLMRKVEVVGARCVLTGIRAAVAETLVDIGVDFGRLTTLRNLKHGLREALRHARRERQGVLGIEPEEDAGYAYRLAPGADAYRPTPGTDAYRSAPDAEPAPPRRGR